MYTGQCTVAREKLSDVNQHSHFKSLHWHERKNRYMIPRVFRCFLRVTFLNWVDLVKSVVGRWVRRWMSAKWFRRRKSVGYAQSTVLHKHVQFSTVAIQYCSFTNTWFSCDVETQERCSRWPGKFAGISERETREGSEHWCSDDQTGDPGWRSNQWGCRGCWAAGHAGTD